MPIAPDEETRDIMVACRGVSVALPAGHFAVRDLTLEVRTGETLVLLGRSGSGKTTVLKLINALRLPTTGDVMVEGRATTAWEPHRLRRRIGYVIQEIGLFPHFTVGANVGLVPRLERWDGARTRARVDELLTLVGLDPARFRDRDPRALSGGQRQRVGLARALAAEPPLLLLDEPFAALDPLTRAELQGEFVALVRRLRTTAVFVTHDVREAMRVGTRLALLAEGRLVYDGPPAGLRSADDAEARAFAAVLDA